MTVIHPPQPWWTPIRGLVWVVIGFIIVFALLSTGAFIVLPIILIVLAVLWAVFLPRRRERVSGVWI